MTEILLTELSNPDIEWISETGRSTEIHADTVLIQPDQSLDTLYVVLEGSLAAVAPATGQELVRFSSGEMVGTLPKLESYLRSTQIRSLTKSRVLAIPGSKLREKLQHDLSFATHLYRASAMLLSVRLDRLLQDGKINAAILDQPQIREGLTVFAELQDSDLDWFIAAGQMQHITAQTALVHRDRPVDALHILLEGVLSLNTAEAESNHLVSAFANLRERPPEAELARLSRGEMVGETLLVETHPSAVTVRALKDCQILSIPRWRLAAKLQHDVGFAARFYRVLAMLLATKHQAILRQCGGSNLLGDTDLAQVGLAEARFEWMLKRIQAQGTGREMQW